jgi:hypothetical protein
MELEIIMLSEDKPGSERKRVHVFSIHLKNILKYFSHRNVLSPQRQSLTHLILASTSQLILIRVLCVYLLQN